MLVCDEEDEILEELSNVWCGERERDDETPLCRRKTSGLLYEAAKLPELPELDFELGWERSPPRKRDELRLCDMEICVIYEFALEHRGGGYLRDM